LGDAKGVCKIHLRRNREGGGFLGSLKAVALAERFNLRGRSSVGGGEVFALIRPHPPTDLSPVWNGVALRKRGGRPGVKRGSLRAVAAGIDTHAMEFSIGEVGVTANGAKSSVKKVSKSVK
jgi:hypothetical protein